MALCCKDTCMDRDTGLAGLGLEAGPEFTRSKRGIDAPLFIHPKVEHMFSHSILVILDKH